MHANGQRNSRLPPRAAFLIIYNAFKSRRYKNGLSYSCRYKQQGYSALLIWQLIRQHSAHSPRPPHTPAGGEWNWVPAGRNRLLILYKYLSALGARQILMANSCCPKRPSPTQAQAQAEWHNQINNLWVHFALSGFTSPALQLPFQGDSRCGAGKEKAKFLQLKQKLKLISIRWKVISCLCSSVVCCLSVVCRTFDWQRKYESVGRD